MSTPTLQLHAAPPEPLESALIRLTGKRLRFLVIGDMVVDCYHHGAARRLSREAAVPIVEVEREVRYPGAAANVMCNLRSLGADVVAASAIGADRAGSLVRRMLADRGIGTAPLIAEPGRRSRVKERLIVRNQHVARYDRGTRSAISVDSENRLFEAVQLLEGIDMVLVCDHQEGVLSPRVMEWLTRWCNRRGIPICVDPDGDDPALYRGATLIKPSREEAENLTGINVVDAASAQAACEVLREATGARYVVITLDEDGLIAFGDRMQRIPTRAQEVREVSGAGDSLFSALAFAIAGGMTFEHAAELSSVAAAIAVAQPGLSTVTMEELQSSIQRTPLGTIPTPIERPEGRQLSLLLDESLPVDSAADAAPGRQLSAEEAEQLAARLRREGKRIVFTNGCFDLLHRGHVEYLAASRRLGDVLIVGVNSDDSVKRLKGPERPVVSQANRLHILSTLRSVDYVVLFNEDTPVDLIRRIRPDVLTKGGDYLGQQVPGAEYAGQLHLVPFIDGCSTTLAIDRIRKAA